MDVGARGPLRGADAGRVLAPHPAVLRHPRVVVGLVEDDVEVADEGVRVAQARTVPQYLVRRSSRAPCSVGDSIVLRKARRLTQPALPNPPNDSVAHLMRCPCLSSLREWFAAAWAQMGWAGNPDFTLAIVFGHAPRCADRVASMALRGVVISTIRSTRYQVTQDGNTTPPGRRETRSRAAWCGPSAPSPRSSAAGTWRWCRASVMRDKVRKKNEMERS
eukprot:COSAG04_NODE_1237_length_7611_cov_4.313498_6_plen_219_part_00